MRPIQILALFAVLLTAIARPKISAEEERQKELLDTRFHYLSERWCANPCGQGGLCCGTSQTCITSAQGSPQCSDGGGGQQQNVQNGQWQFFTSTFVSTDTELVTMVTTYSSYIAAQTTAAAPPAISAITCTLAMGETPCGTICCATGQQCAYLGQCIASNNQDESSSVYVVQSTATAIVNTAPIRPTSVVATTVTSTGSVTTTLHYLTPSAAATSAPAMNATTSNNGLSGGAIAGIVIGVLVGLFIFFLICAILCCRGIIDAILDFFGLRNRRRKETIIEERYSHHSGGGGGGGGGRTWYGAARPSRIEREKKSSGIGGWAAVAGGLGTLAILLGLKRRKDRRRDDRTQSSSYSYSYDSESFTSPSK